MVYNHINQYRLLSYSKKEGTLMKKTFSLLLTLVMCLSLCACGTGSGLASTATSDTGSSETITEPEVLTEKEQIEKILTERIEEYHNAVIDRITINDDLGTEDENDYIALVYLTWNTKNSGKLSKEMLKMYSDDLAATLANENDTVQEIAIFWTVPYLNDTAKCSYERVPDGFVVMDEMWGKAFS
jgi:hypothetical protein